eukprot:GHVT01039514.1.p1 GENE.GHVT01039514.1~~GHVT01039514.1.p1  ORF type:complete len:140 (+),score=32.05 GHVT01039514.1:252-671(+)
MALPSQSGFRLVGAGLRARLPTAGGPPSLAFAVGARRALQLGAPTCRQPPPVWGGPRFFASAAQAESPATDKLIARVQALEDSLLAANWSDYLGLVLDSPFWREELALVEQAADPLRHHSQQVNERNPNAQKQKQTPHP